jgi:hypothetical protein
MTLQGIQTSWLPEVAPYWLAHPGAVQCDRADLKLDQPFSGFSGSQARPRNENC